MKEYQPKDAASAAIAQALKLAGNNLSREGILKGALQLNDFAAPMLLPGNTMTMSADNYNLFRTIQLMRFDGTRRVPQGKPVGE
jgi:branched-chain amino acid transport system substrate-binding protein